MTDIDIIIRLDDDSPKIERARELVISRLASLLSLGIYEGVDVIVRMARPGTDPTIVHARDGKVRTERERPQPSTEG